jgi:16S rRNA (cytosine967-C5)-methyltransferase
MSVTPSWLRTLQSEPLIWLRAKLGTGQQLAAELGFSRLAGSGPLADTLEYYGEQDLFRSRAFHAGEFEIQDIASQLVGLISPPQAGETWWDACAGEGGKTLHYSELMRNSGLIWATDRAAWRLAKLKRRAARARAFNYQCMTWDGGAALPFRTRFDGVLVDSPCSGIGTWQRNPQARWTTSGNDIKELAQRQINLLKHAGSAVKNGGKLVYAVCTLSRLETTGVAQEFTEQNPDFTPLPLSLVDGHFSTQGAQHCWWPQTTRDNGMFVAVWKRNPSKTGK